MALPSAARPYVLSGPTGVGKSSLIRQLMSQHPGTFGFTISHTTRAPRADEQNGVDYYFVDRQQMTDMIKRGDFIEHAQYGECQYGTSRQAVRDVLTRGRICLIDIDTQGTRSVRTVCADMRPVCIFIKPPSFDELDRRLRSICGPDDVVRRRLDLARAELSTYDSEKTKLFDHCVTNDNLDRACQEIIAIMKPSIEWSKQQKQLQPQTLPPPQAAPPAQRSNSPQPLFSPLTATTNSNQAQTTTLARNVSSPQPQPTALSSNAYSSQQNEVTRQPPANQPPSTKSNFEASSAIAASTPRPDPSKFAHLPATPAATVQTATPIGMPNTLQSMNPQPTPQPLQKSTIFQEPQTSTPVSVMLNPPTTVPPENQVHLTATTPTPAPTISLSAAKSTTIAPAAPASSVSAPTTITPAVNVAFTEKPTPPTSSSAAAPAVATDQPLKPILQPPHQSQRERARSVSPRPPATGERIALPIQFEFPKTQIKPQEAAAAAAAAPPPPSGGGGAAAANQQPATNTANAQSTPALPAPPPAGCCAGTSKQRAQPSAAAAASKLQQQQNSTSTSTPNAETPATESTPTPTSATEEMP